MTDVVCMNFDVPETPTNLKSAPPSSGFKVPTKKAPFQSPVPQAGSPKIKEEPSATKQKKKKNGAKKEESPAANMDGSSTKKARKRSRKSGDDDETPKKKKALSGYNLFQRDHMAKLKAEPDFKPKEAWQQMSEAWKQVSEDEKAEYKQRAKTLNEENAEVEDGHAEAPKEKGGKGKAKGKAKKGDGRGQEKKKEKRAMSGYNLYMKEEMARLKSESSESKETDAFKQAGEGWENVTDTGKAEYKARAKALFDAEQAAAAAAAATANAEGAVEDEAAQAGGEDGHDADEDEQQQEEEDEQADEEAAAEENEWVNVN